MTMITINLAWFVTHLLWPTYVSDFKTLASLTIKIWKKTPNLKLGSFGWY